MAAGEGDLATRKHAWQMLPKVARIFTHLSHFLTYYKQFGHWNRTARNGLAAWYNDKEAAKLMYQVLKYPQRDGWSHLDVIRLAHPKPVDDEHDAIYHYLAKHGLELPITQYVADTWKWPYLLFAVNKLSTTEDEGLACSLIREHNLTREMVPTKFLKSPAVWEALLEDMPATALLRNLGNMSKRGLLVDGNWDAINKVTAYLEDEEYLRRGRIHPLSVLVALKTYSQGRGVRGGGNWPVVSQVVDALDAAFYKTFGLVKPTGKNLLLAIDVSGSMAWGEVGGMTGITPRVGAAAMALVTSAVENRCIMLGFSHKLVKLDLSSRRRLDDVCEYMNRLPFGATDCAQPMLWAIENKATIDAFIVLTDAETWANPEIHPVQALDEYRRKFNPRAKMVIGFSASTPNVISDFIRE